MKIQGPERSGKNYYLPMETQLPVSSRVIYHLNLLILALTSSGWAAVNALVTRANVFPWEGKGQREEQREPHPPP